MISMQSIFKMLYAYAQNSDDIRTQVGCVIFEDKAGFDRRIISLGVNQFPDGIAVLIERQSIENKHYYMLHSEEDAIIKARQDLTGTSIALPFICCSRCARMIIHAGIRKVYYDKTNHEKYIKQDHIKQSVIDDFEFAISLLKEAEVELKVYPK